MLFPRIEQQNNILKENISDIQNRLADYEDAYKKVQIGKYLSENVNQNLELYKGHIILIILLSFFSIISHYLLRNNKYIRPRKWD